MSTKLHFIPQCHDLIESNGPLTDEGLGKGLHSWRKNRQKLYRSGAQKSCISSNKSGQEFVLLNIYSTNTQGETHELHKYTWGQAGIGSFMESGTITATIKVISKVLIRGWCNLATHLIMHETRAIPSQDNCFLSQHLRQDYQQAKSVPVAVTDSEMWRVIISSCSSDLRYLLCEAAVCRPATE